MENKGEFCFLFAQTTRQRLCEVQTSFSNTILLQEKKPKLGLVAFSYMAGGQSGVSRTEESPDHNPQTRAQVRTEMEP